MSASFLRGYLKRDIRYILLGRWPTPIERVNFKGYNLYIKRDDLSEERFGGNKIRKLELLFPKIQHKTLVSFGVSSSHHLAALALFSKIYGYKLISVVKEQKFTDYQQKLYDIIKQNSALIISIDNIRLKEILGLLKVRDYYIVPPGGTTPLTTLGYIGAIVELKEQLDSLALPYPEKIYVAVGSGGTVAGIVAGLSLLNLQIKVVGVKIVNSFTATKNYIINLAKLSLKYLNYKFGLKINYSLNPSLLYIEDRFIGPGYGYPTVNSYHSKEFLKGFVENINIETTYTGKTLGALLYNERNNPNPVLYWHTAPNTQIFERS